MPVAVTGSVQTGHVGITSDDPNNLTGQIFMKGERENTILMLIGGLNSIAGISSTEFQCGQDFSVPDHTVSYDLLNGAVMSVPGVFDEPLEQAKRDSIVG